MKISSQIHRIKQAKKSWSLQKWLFPFFAGVSALFFAGGCSAPPSSEPLTLTGTWFDTVISVQIWGGTQEMLSHCEALCDNYEQMFSATIPSSQVSRISHAGGEPVQVSGETADLIRMGIRYGELSDGAFDITIASAFGLWEFTDNPEKLLPDEEVLSEAVTHIDYQCIQTEGNTVQLTDPQAKIDLGGIAKGYIADQLKAYLEDQGVEHGLIDLGGNILTLGNRYDGDSFRIGLQQPFAETGTPAAVLEVEDQSVVSSGSYERYFEKDGIIYHHILDPDTGMPVQNGLTQVTILSDSSAEGDALSTACFVLGAEKGMELIRSLDGIEAVFITEDGEILLSDEDLPISFP